MIKKPYSFLMCDDNDSTPECQQGPPLWVDPA